jgi:sugar phosphate isomerase/epimerase
MNQHGRSPLDATQRTNQSSRRRFLGQAGLALAGGTLASLATPETPAAEQGDGYKIGCWTRPWSGYDYRVAMDAVAEAGYRYIALTGAKTKTGRVIAPATPIDEARQAGDDARQRGLTITYVYGGGFPMHEGPEPLRRMIDNCAAAGAMSLVMGHFGPADQLAATCQTIADCCDYAAERNVGLVVKPHGGLCATGPACREIVERVDHENCSILYDAGNIAYYSGNKLNPVDDAATVAGLVTGWSVKDYRHPRQVMLTPGTGELDLKAVFAKLRQGGFTEGVLAVECLTQGNPEHLLAEAKKARRFVEEIVAGDS